MMACSTHRLLVCNTPHRIYIGLGTPASVHPDLAPNKNAKHASNAPVPKVLFNPRPVQTCIYVALNLQSTNIAKRKCCSCFGVYMPQRTEFLESTVQAHLLPLSSLKSCTTHARHVMHVHSIPSIRYSQIEELLEEAWSLDKQAFSISNSNRKERKGKETSVLHLLQYNRCWQANTRATVTRQQRHVNCIGAAADLHLPIGLISSWTKANICQLGVGKRLMHA